jgi:hypothetical protein
MLEAIITADTGPGYAISGDEESIIAAAAEQAILHGANFVVYRGPVSWCIARNNVPLPCQQVTGVLHRLITIEVLSKVAVPQRSLTLLVLEDVTVTEKEVKQ